MAVSPYKKVTHCIFDMDGLLIDTEYLYTEMYNRVLNKYGKTFTWEHKAKTMGYHTKEVMIKMVEMFNLPISPQELEEQIDQHKEIFYRSQFLPDSEIVYKQIYHRIVSACGHKYDGQVMYEIMGRPERVGAELTINHYKLPLTVNEFQDKYHQLQQELFTNVNMMPGAERLLRHLKAHNVPIALATSSSLESFMLKTNKLQEVFDLFHHKVLGGSDPDVTKGKPNPDIFLVAASRFPDKPHPSQCLVFEDAPNGVLAAISAGMQVVMVPDSNLPKELISDQVTLKLNSLEEFKPELFGLPPFEH